MKVTAKAPVNIALIKYWGKLDEEKVVPFNSSLSISLDSLYTLTTISESDNFMVTLNDRKLEGKEEEKVFNFLKNFASTNQLKNVKVESINYVPTAAGLSSSSSAFASLAIASNVFFNKNYSLDELTQIARLGSGSACRSIYGGFVAWEKDGKVYEIKSKFTDLVLISVIIDERKKAISSRDAMKITANTSPLYKYFVSESNNDFLLMKDALIRGDIKLVGKLAMKSFLMMHGAMLSSNPPILYINDVSIKVIELVSKMQNDDIYAYPTMDAGCNVKIITKEDSYLKVMKILNENGFTNLIVSRLGKGAMIIDE